MSTSGLFRLVGKPGWTTYPPDPQFTSYCLDALDRCRTKGQRPDFDLDECVLALFSLEGGNLDWAKSAIGPRAASSCLRCIETKS